MGVIYVVIVIAFVIVGVVVVRRTQRGAIVARLPIDEGEQRSPRRGGPEARAPVPSAAARGGGTVTHRVRSVLTDRRVLLATGGPEGSTHS